MKKLNIRLTDDLYDNYKSKAERTGVPMSSLILLDLQTMKDQQEAMSLIGKMVNALDDGKLKEQESRKE